MLFLVKICLLAWDCTSLCRLYCAQWGIFILIIFLLSRMLYLLISVSASPLPDIIDTDHCTQHCMQQYSLRQRLVQVSRGISNADLQPLSQ